MSPTKLTTYLACPLKFRWTYLDPRGRWYLKSKSYYSFGTTLHRILQRFHDSGDVGVETLEQAMPAFEEGWLDAGYSSPEEMQQAMGEGREILTRHIEEHVSLALKPETLYVEKSLKLPFEEFDLIGRVDRIDRHADGSLEIIDYKSGRHEVSVEDVQNDLALSCYQLMARREFPGQRIYASLIALRTGNKASYEMDDDEISTFQNDIGELGREIFGKNWEETRAFAKPICGTCDFVRLCRQDVEFTG